MFILGRAGGCTSMPVLKLLLLLLLGKCIPWYLQPQSGRMSWAALCWCLSIIGHWR